MRDEWYVKIPKSVEPKFPNLCVACGASPTTTFRVADDTIGWWAVLPGMSLYSILTGRGINVPACDACVGPMRRGRRTREIVQWVIAIVGVIIGFWIFRDWTGLARRFAVLGVVLVVALPYIAWEIMFPPAVDIIVTDSNVRYTFTNKEFADQFASENPIVPS